MSYVYRSAVPEDAPRCVFVRGQTRENAMSVAQLKAIGVTADTWSEAIRDGSLPGYVCLFDDAIIAYCFGSAEMGEIIVLVVLAEHEGQGIGRQLLNTMIADLNARGHQRLFLGCSSNPEVRSYGFYRHEGWESTGMVDETGDEVLEYLIQ